MNIDDLTPTDNGLDAPDLTDALRHDADERLVPHDEDEYR